MSRTPEIIIAAGWPVWRLWASMAWRSLRHPRRRTTYIRGPGAHARDIQLLYDLLESKARQLHGALKELDEVEQVLGKALGYPTCCPEVYPIDDGRVCVGEHTAASLAAEAAGRLGNVMGLYRSACGRAIRGQARVETLEAEIGRSGARIADLEAELKRMSWLAFGDLPDFGGLELNIQRPPAAKPVRGPCLPQMDAISDEIEGSEDQS